MNNRARCNVHHLSCSLAWLLPPSEASLEDNTLELYGYIALLSEDQRSQFKKSLKIIQLEANKVFWMVRSLDEEAEGDEYQAACESIRRERAARS
jgi:hypothetical protein